MNAVAEVPGIADTSDSAARSMKALDVPNSLAGQMASGARRTLPAAKSPRSFIGSILVGHSSPLVAAGLLATLRGLLHHVVAPRELTGVRPEELGARTFDLVIADRAVAGSLVRFATSLDPSGRSASPKILLIGAGAGSSREPHACPVPYDACLPLECGTGELVDVIDTLIGSGPSGVLARVSRPSWSLESRAPVRNARPNGGLPPAALRRVREAMEQRFDEKLELAELAALAGVSRSHFARAFKESVGQSPHRYLIMRRVSVAEELIKDTDRTLTDISVDLGFFDQSHFVRVFSRVVGETPSAYRRRCRSE